MTRWEATHLALVRFGRQSGADAGTQSEHRSPQIAVSGEHACGKTTLCVPQRPEETASGLQRCCEPRFGAYVL